MGGLQAPNSFLILWSLLSENGKMPSGPSSFEMAEKFREFSAPLPSRRSLYLGQSQMGMCFKLPNPLADVRCDHFRQAGLCHGKPWGPRELVSIPGFRCTNNAFSGLAMKRAVYLLPKCRGVQSAVRKGTGCQWELYE